MFGDLGPAPADIPVGGRSGTGYATRSTTTRQADMTEGSSSPRTPTHRVRHQHHQGPGEFALQIGASFRAGVADTSWTGDDSYGHTLKAKFTANTAAAQKTFDAIGEGVSAIGDGTLSNLNETLKTQTGVLDSISQESAATSVRRAGSHDMAIMVSPKLNWLFFILIGETFLQANEDGAYDKSAPFGKARRDVHQLKLMVDTAVDRVVSRCRPRWHSSS